MVLTFLEAKSVTNWENIYKKMKNKKKIIIIQKFQHETTEKNKES